MVKYSPLPEGTLKGKGLYLFGHSQILDGHCARPQPHAAVKEEDLVHWHNCLVKSQVSNGIKCLFGPP